MSEVMDVVNALGTPLKIAWVGWIAWGLGQYFWFRHERSMPMRKVTSVAKPVAKKPAVPKSVAAQAADAPVVGRLFTPTHVTSEARASQPTVPVVAQVQAQPTPVPTPMPVSSAPESPVPVFDPSKAVAAFDPSTAVIEQFGATDDNVLDKFVRDFEMQDARPRRRKPTRVPETPSYGAEAPQTP